MKPYFSIIIPTLNEEKFVGKLLGDIIRQTYRDFEVIVADARSEDKTLIEVKKFKQYLPTLRTISLQERHVAKQRNTAARLAKGKYLVFLDADARINKGFLKELVQFITKQKGLLFLPKLSNNTNNDPQMDVAIDFSNAFVALSHKVGRPFSTGGSMIVERYFFSHIGGFPEDVHLSEDHLLVQNAHKYGVMAKLMPTISVQFSLRRFTREGKLSMLLKYIKSTIYFLAKGKVDRKIIEYEMGGHLYKKIIKDFNKIIRH